MTSGPVVRSGAVAGLSLPETSTPYCSPFGPSFAPSFVAPTPNVGAAYPARETPLFRPPSHTMGVSHPGLNMLQTAQVAPLCSGTGMVKSPSVRGSPHMGLNMNPLFRGVVQSGSLGNPLADPLLLGTGMGQSSVVGGNRLTGHANMGGSTQGGGAPFQPRLLSGSGSGETVHKNNNPFLFWKMYLFPVKHCIQWRWMHMWSNHFPKYSSRISNCFPMHVTGCHELQLPSCGNFPSGFLS